LLEPMLLYRVQEAYAHGRLRAAYSMQLKSQSCRVKRGISERHELLWVLGATWDTSARLIEEGVVSTFVLLMMRDEGERLNLLSRPVWD
jgi:hypothetical protein